jgi:hypothetical protein
MHRYTGQGRACERVGGRAERAQGRAQERAGLTKRRAEQVEQAEQVGQAVAAPVVPTPAPVGTMPYAWCSFSLQQGATADSDELHAMVDSR